MSENMSMPIIRHIGNVRSCSIDCIFVISYAVHFMLEQRKKEFATYELLGMETSNIQKLFFIEKCDWHGGIL